MSESKNTKGKAIPSWQQTPAEESPVKTKDTTQLPLPQQLDARTPLIEKACKFLQDDEIRDASKERKMTFLESKDLTETEIAQLLDTDRAERPTAPSNTTETPPQNPDSNVVSDSSPASRQDGPPIITYPEFLLHSQKPPPLITAQRLLTTLYIVSGAAATIYGTSKYIVEPMIESLSSARHSVFESASTNVSVLNEKLEGAVSTVPDIAKGIQDPDDSDIESVSSDPARHFSRTVATQTTPQLSRSASSSSLSSAPTPPAPISHHAEHLSRLHQGLSDLKPSSDLDDPVRDSLQELQDYLQGLPWQASVNKGSKFDSGDSIARVKADIKGVKGALLSARSFPAGSAGR